MASKEYTENELADFIWNLLGTSSKSSIEYKHLLPYIEDMGLPFADDIYSLFELVDPRKTGTISYFDFLDILSNEFHPLRSDAALDSLYKNIVGPKGTRMAVKDLMKYAQDLGIELSQAEAAEIVGKGLKADEFKDIITS
jgi:Ca2+-binding EF-hand superfamily protein